MKHKDLPPPGTMGRRIYDWRINRRWSQARLGKEIGVHQVTISRLEQNVVEKGYADSMSRLADLMGMTVERLRTGVQKEARGPSEREVLEVYRNMDPDFRQAWLDKGRKLALVEPERKKTKEYSA